MNDLKKTLLNIKNKNPNVNTNSIINSLSKVGSKNKSLTGGSQILHSLMMMGKGKVEPEKDAKDFDFKVVV